MFWILDFATEICNVSLVLKNNVFVRITEQNYESNLIKYNVKFYTKPILLFLDEILMLRILHQLCKVHFPCFVVVQDAVCISFPGFLVPRRALLFWGIFVRGFARRDLC